MAPVLRWFNFVLKISYLVWLSVILENDQARSHLLKAMNQFYVRYLACSWHSNCGRVDLCILVFWLNWDLLTMLISFTFPNNFLYFLKVCHSPYFQILGDQISVPFLVSEAYPFPSFMQLSYHWIKMTLTTCITKSVVHLITQESFKMHDSNCHNHHQKWESSVMKLN